MLTILFYVCLVFYFVEERIQMQTMFVGMKANVVW